MKLAVIGLAVRTRPRNGYNSVSEQQLAILNTLQMTPGLSVHQIKEVIIYAARANIDRALQGLIRKGYLRWETNPVTNGFKYYLTHDGKQMLSSSSG